MRRTVCFIIALLLTALFVSCTPDGDEVVGSDSEKGDPALTETAAGAEKTTSPVEEENSVSESQEDETDDGVIHLPKIPFSEESKKFL